MRSAPIGMTPSPDRWQHRPLTAGIVCGLAAWTVIVAAPGAVSTADPLTINDPASSELERVHAEIAAYKAFPQGLEHWEIARLVRSLVERYFVALGPEIETNGRFALKPDRAEDRAERIQLFADTIQGHLRQWHPAFSFAALETVFYGGSGGLLDLAGFTTTRRRPAEITLDRMLEAAFAGRVNGTVARALVTDEPHQEQRAVQRSAKLIGEIFVRPEMASWALRMRTAEDRLALAEQIRGVYERTMAASGLPDGVRRLRVSTLLSMLVILQTDAARDQLLLLFDDLDAHRDREWIGENRAYWETTLAQTLASFVARNGIVGSIGYARFDLDVIDHLMRAVNHDVWLQRGQLRDRRVIETLLAIKKTSPSILVAYLDHVHSDFHALNVRSFKAVVFSLSEVVLDYADIGTYVLGDLGPDGRRKVSDSPPDHEMVMDTLRWFNQAFAERAANLPEFELTTPQRHLLERLFSTFEVEPTGVRQSRFRKAFPEFVPVDFVFRWPPEYVATALMLMRRLAHTVDPEIIKERVLYRVSEVALTRALNGDRQAESRGETASLWATIGEPYHPSPHLLPFPD